MIPDDSPHTQGNGGMSGQSFSLCEHGGVEFSISKVDGCLLLARLSDGRAERLSFADGLLWRLTKSLSKRSLRWMAPACPIKDCTCDREFNMVVIARNQDRKPTVWCDPCLAPLVRALNDVGVKTVASCCGHGERDGSIILEDGHELKLTRRRRRD